MVDLWLLANIQLATRITIQRSSISEIFHMVFYLQLNCDAIGLPISFPIVALCLIFTDLYFHTSVQGADCRMKQDKKLPSQTDCVCA